MRLPGGLLREAVTAELTKDYDAETHAKDPEFYPVDFVELVRVFSTLPSGAQLALSIEARNRLIETVREIGWDSDVASIRAQATTWLKENGKR